MKTSTLSLQLLTAAGDVLGNLPLPNIAVSHRSKPSGNSAPVDSANELRRLIDQVRAALAAEQLTANLSPVALEMRLAEALISAGLAESEDDIVVPIPISDYGLTPEARNPHDGPARTGNTTTVPNSPIRADTTESANNPAPDDTALDWNSLFDVPNNAPEPGASDERP